MRLNIRYYVKFKKFRKIFWNRPAIACSASPGSCLLLQLGAYCWFTAGLPSPAGHCLLLQLGAYCCWSTALLCSFKKPKFFQDFLLHQILIYQIFIKVLFSSLSKFFRNTVALSFVCSNYCPIMD